MANLNSTDLLVRVQLIGCKLSVLSKKFADDLKYGKKCTPKDRETLLLLNIYLEILQCYNVICVPGQITLSTGIIQVTAVNINDSYSIRLSVGPVNMGSYTALTTSTTDFMIGLTDSINSQSATTKVVAVFSPGDPGIITLTGPCTNPLVDISVSGLTATPTTSINNTMFSGGICSTTCPTVGTPCFTELDIQNILDKIEELGNICFQAPGFSYTDN